MKAILIGTGMVAKTHVMALRDSAEGIRLCGILGRNPDRSAAFADTASAILGYTVPVLADLQDSQPDMAIVLTPPDARIDIVSALVQRAIPILMEKPIERDLPRARQIVETCDRAGVPLGMVLQHRTRKAARALSQRIAAHALGQIASVEIRLPWWRDQAYYDEPGRGTYARDGGGVMLTQAIHILDLALSLLGPVRRVQAIMHRTPLHRLEAEDWAGALLHFASGAVGTLHATTAAFPGSAESITVHGTLGSAHLVSGRVSLAFHDGTNEEIGEPVASGGGADPMAFSHAPHTAILDDFARALRNGTQPIAPGRDVLHAHAVIDAMERAGKSGMTEEVQQ